LGFQRLQVLHGEEGQAFAFTKKALLELRRQVCPTVQQSLRLLTQVSSAQEDLIGRLLNELAAFSGPGWEQEDDVTFLRIARVPIPPAPPVEDAGWKVLAEFDLPSQPGNEMLAIEKVVEAIRPLGMDETRLERLKTAVAEAAMNGMEHGNHYQADVPVEIQVLDSSDVLSVRVTDHGGGQEIPEPELPDLEAKLAGMQSPRGWGLFLIKNMVDEMKIRSDGIHHTVDLILKKGSRK
jgi:anti-sigma regulatory factor (Ser/Thr protein kinase)